jgi:tetratricopeptide (TPR) repeat protein
MPATGHDTDYDTELARIEAEIAALQAPPEARDPGKDREKRIVYKRYQHASLRGDFRALDTVSRAIDALVDPARPDPDMCYLKANVAFKFHRLDIVRHALDASPALAAGIAGRALCADLDAQHGRYIDAQDAYRAIIRDERSWDNLARLAHLEYKLGDIDAAERHFEEAEDELTAKEMRHYAWLELQRGLLDLSRGRHADADAHYARAARAYSGHWMVDEHRAELLATRGDGDAAAALYEDVLKKAPRPELMQALGELYAFIGRDEQAERWFGAASAAYLESVERGEVHYLHHLADFHADVRPDGDAAVRWAERDLALRENHATLAALAWALHRAGRHDDAVAPMERALAFGVSDAHLFMQAAAVMQAAGRDGDGEALAARARGINPHVNGFHVHR